MSNKLIYANCITIDHDGNLNNSKVFIDKIVAISDSVNYSKMLPNTRLNNKEHIAIECIDGVRIAKCTFQEFLNSIRGVDLKF